MPLLTDEEILNCWKECKAVHGFDVKKYALLKQSRRDYEWLHEPCKGHPLRTLYLGIRKEGEHKQRKDCPECMEAWKKELGL